MAIRNTIDKLMDGTVFLVFPRAKYYRNIGVDYTLQVFDKIPGVIGSLPEKSAEFIEKNLTDYKNRVYLNVIGQYSLINMDIFGIDLKERRDETHKAAIAAGLLWYGIKLIDNHADEGGMQVEDVCDFLNLTKDSLKSRKHVNTGDKEVDTLINSTNDLIYSGYAGNPADYMDSLEQVCESEINYILSPKELMVENTIKRGAASANLNNSVLNSFIPEYPGKCREFVVEQVITGQLFDDYKDLEIDRQHGRGYDDSQVGKLKKEGLNHFYKHFAALPDMKTKWRNANFIALATLFYVKELLGVKEKS